MAIDITNTELLMKLTMKDLVADAVEKKNIEALRFLEDESRKTTTRTNKKSGVTYETVNPIISIRAAYLRKYCGYVPQSTGNSEARKAAKKAKREQERSEMFAAAFAEITGGDK